MIGHYHSSVKIPLAAVPVQAAIKDDASSSGREFPSVIASKGDEDWSIVFLNVWKPATVVVLAPHVW
jgi:hypothetical protein